MMSENNIVRFKRSGINVTNFPINDSKNKPLSVLNYRIAMTRDLARSAWNVTYREKRILMLAISRIDYSKGSPKLVKWNGESLDFGTVMVTAEDYAEFTQTSISDSLRDMRTVAKNLEKTSVSLLSAKSSVSQKISCVCEKYYSGSDGTLIIKFTKEMLSHLHDFGSSDGYASYRLNQSKNLSHSSWRLLELLKSFPPENAPMSITNLKHAFTTSNVETSYLLRKFVRPAVKELREKLGWNLKYTVSKRHRKFNMIKFTNVP